ncbi:ATP-binding protein [Paenibacillus herberti]|uniref:ATP-binding protein n=1 Tax=Paenibacillus herberti TaxID=1619309 RepID=UPI0015963762|nr:ATP-binding protein [Paenibacillus herberti]
MALFFYEERIIAPIKAFFIGVFAPILQMGIILIYTTSSPESIRLVNEIGVPMVLASSIGIALFVAMIQVALREQERAGAVETQRALAVAGTVLPHLEQKLTEESAAEAARVLSMTLSVDAVAVTDMTSVLAYTGPGMERSRPEHPAVSALCQKAVRTGEIVVAELAAYADSSPSQAAGGQLKQKLTALARRGTLEGKQGPGAVVLIPFQQAGQPVGMLQLFYRSRKHVCASRLIGGVVQVSVRREGGAIRIGVQDNGIGIRPELLSSLGLMPLESGEESSGISSTAGNGLGVYNVNERLIRLVGAEAALHYRNLPEEGSRVEFRLPGERREHYEGEAYRADRRR